jgi:cytochrome c peroxidase
MTLTVFNAALNFRLNWKGQFRSLEEQAGAALTNPDHMATTPENAVAALVREPGMPERFRQVYGHGPSWDSIRAAIAAYERSLLTPDSRFDDWLRGDAHALSEQELAGYRLFKSLGCVSCHQGTNVGGNLFEKSGVFHPLSAGEPPLLRVPSLRNIATLAPYFHDGSSPTLSCAVRKMAYVQLNLRISDDDTAAIVGFLGSLTGRYDGRPLLPK